MKVVIILLDEINESLPYFRRRSPRVEILVKYPLSQNPTNR